MNRRILALLLVLGALAAAWCVIPGPSRGEGWDFGDSASIKTDIPSAKPEKGAPHSRGRPPAAHPGKRRRISPQGRGRASSSGKDLEILVVWKSTGKVVPKCPLIYLDSQVSFLSLFTAQGRDFRKFRSWLETRGATLQTDSGGRARVSRPFGEGIFLAGDGDAWALKSGVYKDSPSPIRLELARPRRLLVQVAGRDGTPRPGIPVVLRFLRGNSIQDLLRAVTRAPGGTAELGPLNIIRMEKMYPGERAVVTFAFPTGGKAGVQIAPGPFPSQPVRLILPPTGSVVVHVKDGKGNAIRKGAFVSLAPSFVSTLSLQDPESLEPVPVRDGEALFPMVGLGLRLKVCAYLKGGLCPVTTIGKGPEFPGERIVFHLSFGNSNPVVTGLAVDPAGNPLSLLSLQWELWNLDRKGNTAFTSSSDSETDEEGRFRLELGGRSPQGGRRIAVLMVRVPSGKKPIGLARRLELPAGLEPGEVRDLGRITFSPLPILVSGTVVDGEGNPLENVRISPMGEGFFSPVSTDSTGSFQVRGILLEDALSLYCHKEGYASTNTPEFPAGAGGVKVIMKGGGRLEGSLLLDSRVPPERVRIRVLPSRGRYASCFPDRKGRFSLSPIPPGPARVRIEIPGQEEPVEVLEGVQILVSGTTRDPRLQGLDLRDKIHVLELVVVDPGGKPISGARAWFGKKGNKEIPSRGGKIQILAAGRPLDVLVSAPGFRPKLLERLSSGRKVVLRPGIPVVLNLPPDFSLPSPPFFLQARLENLEGEKNPAGRLHFLSGGLIFEACGEKDGTFRPGNRAWITLPSPGRYRLKWIAAFRREDVYWGIFVPGAKERILEIEDLPGTREFHLSLDPEALKKALKKLKRKKPF